MALTAAQLSDLVTKAKTYLRKSDDDASLLQEGFTVYHDESASATAATSQLSGTTLTLVITGGANAGTDTFDLTNASYDTLTELVAAINALAKGFVADLVGDGAADSGTLRPLNTVSCFGFGNMQTLQYTDDAALELIVQQCFDAIETACDRSFFAADYDELVFTGGGRVLVLEQPRVRHVEFLGADTFDAMRVSYNGAADWATVEVTDEKLYIRERTGKDTTETGYNFNSANADTIGEIVTDINGESGWSATLVNEGASEFLSRSPAVAVKNVVGTREITRDAWKQTDDSYSADYDAGILYLSNYPTYGIVRVLYNAGYDALPTDVERELLRLVAAQYHELGRDASAIRMKLGDYEIATSATAAKDSLDIEQVAGRLAQYKRVLP